MAGSDLDIAQVHPGAGHGRDKCMPEHVRVRPGDPYARIFRESPESPGGGVPVHACAAGVEQDRAGQAGADGRSDGTGANSL